MRSGGCFKGKNVFIFELDYKVVDVISVVAIHGLAISSRYMRANCIALHVNLSKLIECDTISETDFDQYKITTGPLFCELPTQP